MNKVKIIFSILTWLTTGFTYKAMSQDAPKTKSDKESQEITIRKKGNKDANITIQITGDKVIVNGKPLAEFKDDEISINNKRIIVRDGNSLSFYDGNKALGNMGWAKAGSRVYLGVSTEKADGGAKVTDVVKGSPAEKAGLQKDDIITKLEGKSIDGPQALYDAVTSKKEKENVKINYLRDKKDKTATATLENRSESGSFSFTSPDGEYKTFTMPHIPATPHFDMEPFEGIRGMQAFTRRPKLGLKIQDTENGAGVKVMEVEDSSAAAQAGLRKDDIITLIGDTKITNTDEARQALVENTQKTSFPVKAKRGSSDMNFELKFPKKLKTANL